MGNFSIIFLLLLQAIISILILLTINKKRSKEDLFIMCNSMLHDIIKIYYESILRDRVERLKSQFDLDPKSKTQAFKAYTEAYNSLLSSAAKEIMKNYLSKTCLKILLNYYSVDGLVLIIISNLKR